MTEKRTYATSHPWINFKVDLRQVDYKLWLLLGEAQAQCQHIAGTPLLPAVADELYQIYLAKGVLATTAIEGNTLTEDEVRKRLQGELRLPPSKEYLGQEIDNVITACNQIGAAIFSGQPSRLTVAAIKQYNQLILKNLPQGEDVIPGEIRTYAVGVGRYQGAPAEDCGYLLEKLTHWLHDEFKAPNEEYKIVFGILKAILAHLYLAWIHPFGDGNGRTARLMEFQILLASGVPAASAQLLSNHYNQTRSEYYRQLDAASRAGGDPLPFVRYAVQGLVDGLREQLILIRDQQLHVHWINYVHALFPDQASQTAQRQRRLVLDLVEATSPVPVAKLRHLSPRIAEVYAGKTDKTIQRDVNALEAMGLIVKAANGLRIKREALLAFLPYTADNG